MKVKGVFTVPEYYPEFVCKGGACRHTCCSGLEINITEQEYYKLITLDCSPELRDRIDLGVRLNTAADVNRYARIQHNYLGDCKMLDGEGLCALQRECGPDVLNRVCRYYPRSPRIEDLRECSCSNSCEKTLELLFSMAENRKVFRLTERELYFDLAGERFEGSEGAKERSRIHRQLVLLTADESRPLEERLKEIGGDCREKKTKISDLLPLLQALGETYEELSSYIETVSGLLADEGKEQLLSDLRGRYPEFDRFLTLALANDCFYRNIPFGEPGLDPEEDRKVFALTAEILLLLSTILAPEERNVSKLIDLFACYFRVVDLTSFDRNLYVLMKRVGAYDCI